MEESHLDRLLQRYVRGDVSAAERAKIEAWLDALGDEGDDPELTREEEDRIFHKLTSHLTGVEEVIAQERTDAQKSVTWILRIAASLLIVGTLAYMGWYLAAPTDGSVEIVSTNGIDKVILNDGSLVWLRTGSQVLYYEKADEAVRYASFNGEALFEVSKDPDRPFIVECGDTRIKVLGTSFNVRADDEVVEVTVLTGKVNLSNSENTDGVDLLPQERAVCRRNGSFEKITASPGEIAALTLNTDYDMQFVNTRMEAVFERLENKFNTTIEARNAMIADCRITIDLTDQTLEHSLRLISEVLNIEYEIGKAKVVISGNGCN